MPNASKIFVSIIWGYSPNMYSFSPEENYHLHILKVAKETGFKPVVIIKNGKGLMEKDPNFDPETEVLDYENFFFFIFNIIRLSFQGSIFYVNSYEWQSFLIPFLARKTIFMGHNQTKRSSKKLQAIQNFVFRFFTFIRLNNESEKSFLRSQGTDVGKAFVIPLIVSQHVFKLAENEKERKNLVYFGNVTAKKNLNTILMALKEVKITRPNIQLNIIGRIADDGFIPKIRELDLDKNVIMHGYMAQDGKLTELLNSMLIFVNSSKDEGQCVAVYDAALCGCALCLPRIMSFEGVFKDKALFHYTYDYKQLARNILFYLDNPDTLIEYRKKNIEMIKNGYSKETIENKLKEMLIKICE